MLLEMITFADHPIEIEIHHNDTVNRIKECVYQEAGIPPKLQKLFWRGRDMHNTRRTAKQYGLVSGSRVVLIMRRGYSQ